MRAGLAYFALVFALGFAFGTARTLLLPRFPDFTRFAVVLLELPAILTASWLICRFLIRRLAVPNTLRARAIMGAAAFVLLMVVETALGMVLAGETLSGHFALYREPVYALGLAGQAVFALMPLVAGGGPAPSRTRPVR